MPKLTFGTRLTVTPLAARDHYCFYVQERLASLGDANTDTAGTIFYAGVCKLRDVLVCPDAYLNSYWRANVKDDAIIRVTIMCSSERETDMLTELSSFVKLHRPIANVQGEHSTGRSMVTCVVGPKAGMTWHTQQDAARENGVSQPTLSNHLNGRRGYETIRGMRFKRGMA